MYWLRQKHYVFKISDGGTGFCSVVERWLRTLRHDSVSDVRRLETVHSNVFSKCWRQENRRPSVNSQYYVLLFRKIIVKAIQVMRHVVDTMLLPNEYVPNGSFSSLDFIATTRLQFCMQTKYNTVHKYSFSQSGWC